MESQHLYLPLCVNMAVFSVCPQSQARLVLLLSPSQQTVAGYKVCVQEIIMLCYQITKITKPSNHEMIYFLDISLCLLITTSVLIDSISMCATGKKNNIIIHIFELSNKNLKASIWFYFWIIPLKLKSDLNLTPKTQQPPTDEQLSNYPHFTK